MKKRILWIEDDYYAIRGLMRPLERAGFQVDAATSAIVGYQLAIHWQVYDLIVVDLIMPLSNDDRALPNVVKDWDREEHVGIGVLKWLLGDLKVTCPVLLLSVVRHPVYTYQLGGIGLASYLPKRGLLPSQVKTEVFRLLESAAGGSAKAE
jgi:CheY-like chemotaxis protein